MLCNILAGGGGQLGILLSWVLRSPSGYTHAYMYRILYMVNIYHIIYNVVPKNIKDHGRTILW